MLLGGSGVGKTTLFKQLQFIHGDGFDDANRQTYRDAIWEQMIDGLQTMTKVLDEDDNEYDVFEDYKERENTKISWELRTSVDFILGMGGGVFGVAMSEDVADHMRALWHDDAIQRAFELRAKCCIADSTGLCNFVSTCLV